MDEKDRAERHEIFKQSNVAAVEYSNKAMYFAFYLNGGAVAALLTRSGNEYIQAAIDFGWGAFWAVICIGFTYLYQLLIAASWKGDPKEGAFSFDLIITAKIKYSTMNLLRIIPIFFWIISLAQFLIGISKLS